MDDILQKTLPGNGNIKAWRPLRNGKVEALIFLQILSVRPSNKGNFTISYRYSVTPTLLMLEFKKEIKKFQETILAAIKVRNHAIDQEFFFPLINCHLRKFVTIIFGYHT